MTPSQLVQLLVLCLLVKGCVQQGPEQAAKVESPDGKRAFVDSTFRYVEYDSAHYRIQYKYFLEKGELFAVHFMDTLRKIDSVTYFKKNRPSFTRKTTTPNGINIGKWHTLDPKRSVYANYDDSLNVNYWEALTIAQQRGYSLPKIEVSMLREEDRDWWMFYPLNHKGLSNSLLVNCENGTVREMKTTIKK